MRHPFRFDVRRPAVRAALLLAVVLVALQGLSAALLAAGGPLHAHRPQAASPTPDALPLVDFRRTLFAVAGTEPPHRHDGEGAARHHHAADDTTVLAVDDAAALAAAEAGADDARLAQPAFFPLTSDAPRVAAATAGASPAPARADRWRTRTTAPLERPPRAG